MIALADRLDMWIPDLSQVLESRESGASPDMVRLSTYRRLSPANFVTLQGCYLPGK
jgi:hypothetical protein